MARWKFLAMLSADLTVVAREGYEVGTEGIADAVWVRRVNEIHHRVAGHLVKLIYEDDERYPDDVFLNIVLGSDDETLNSSIRNAFNRILEMLESDIL